MTLSATSQRSPEYSGSALPNTRSRGRPRLRKEPPCNVCECGAQAWAPLTKGFVVIVDASDASFLRQHRWQAAKRASLTYVIGEFFGEKVLLHRAILGLAHPLDRADHKNHFGTDNRRENLRPCTNSQNLGNTRLQLRSKSGFKGVQWHSASGKWLVRCRGQYLGLFEKPEDGARAYDAAAKEAFGEFAYLNGAQS